MAEEPNLEERLLENNPKNTDPNSSLLDKIKYHSKYFVVDGVSYVLFYAPIMTATERLSGMDWEEIGRSRTIGAVTGFLSGYAVSLLRQRWGKIVGANTERSGNKKKKVVDIAVGMATTVPFYAPMLYFAGTSAKEMAIALFTGSALAAVAGLRYGHFSDRWRRYWGLPAVLYK